MLTETPAPNSNNNHNYGGGGLSSNDWRMVRMYELMEDFEDVLSRAPVSICTGQEPFLSMGGRSNGNSSIASERQTAAAGEESVPKSRTSGGEDKVQKEATAEADPAIFTAGNCLSGGCCYTSSSTESETVRSDLPKSTSKYKKQRERLLSRPTL